MPINRLLLERVIKEEYDKLLNEFVVPVTYSLSDWKAYRKKNKISNADYHKEHPEVRWKVVHGHKEGEIGKSLKGLSNLSYEKATKAHAAIAMRNEQVAPIAGITSADVSKATLTPVQKQAQEIIDILSKNSSVMTKLKMIDTPEELDAFLEGITQLVTLSNKGSLNQAEVTKTIKQMYSIKRA